VSASRPGRSGGATTVASGDALAARYEQLPGAVPAARVRAGFCYTQFTDAYQETNGLLTAERVPKAPADRVHAATMGDQATGEPPSTV